ncbi:MAG: XAC2610-related protein [Hyphomicrobiales bacterium]
MASRCRCFVLATLIALLPQSALASQAAEDLICTLYTPPRNGVLAECSGPFTADGDDITIALAGTPPNHVREIRLTHDGDARPFQSIAVDARPVIDPETVGILLMDMNFDGHRDLAIMKRLDGKDAGYRYFLYDPAARRFVPNGELGQIAWPEFDPDTKTIQSYRERAGGIRIHDTWTWRVDRLRQTARRERVTGADGTCVEKHYRRKQDTFVLATTKPCP